MLLAGAGIGHPRLLCARRSRSDPVLARLVAPPVRRAHRRHRALDHVALSCLLAGPLINMLALSDGPHWLAAYGVLAAGRAVGRDRRSAITHRPVPPDRPEAHPADRPDRRRASSARASSSASRSPPSSLMATCRASRVFQSAELIAAAPDLESLLWLPGPRRDGRILPRSSSSGRRRFGALIAVIAAAASELRHGTPSPPPGCRQARVARRRRDTPLPPRLARSRRCAARNGRCCARDPWLLSQTLMQILYLLPPALMLWLNFGQRRRRLRRRRPGLVMASGQLAGGLAWLAISGEDAHDLVVTAPVAPRAVLHRQDRSGARRHRRRAAAAAAADRAGLALGGAGHRRRRGAVGRLGDRHPALVPRPGAGAPCSAAARSPRASRRSREAFASIMWAGASALAVSGSFLAIGPAIVALGVLGLARALSPAARKR